MYTIKNHIVQEAKFIRSPNRSGTLTNPSLIVMHYTASGRGGENDAKYFSNPAAKASAHFVLDEDGNLFQCVELNQRAWHAGKSVWGGKANCNDFSIGIEVDNWGILTKTEEGRFKSYSGIIVPADRVVKAKNKRGVEAYWQTYTKKQLDALDELTKALIDTYPSIKEVVGHEDIAPGRKIDPGPAFPLQRYDNLVDSRGSSTVIGLKKSTTTSVNLRISPTTNSTILQVIPALKQVQENYFSSGWSNVTTSEGATGWVYSQYLVG